MHVPPTARMLEALGAPTQAAPLADIRVLAVEQYAAGPFATLQLSEMGAEVIKIEDPDRGEIGREVPPDAADGDSLFFQSFNHGKRSLGLDLRCPAGREVFELLVPEADVVFSNLRGDVPAKLRLTYADLQHLNPRLVCCSLSAYGMTGPRAAEPGYDYLVQGLAGWMSLTGEPDAPPTKSGLSVVDFASGYVAAASMLAAVHAARSTGVGADLDLSLFDVGVSMLTYLATWHLTLGLVPQRTSHSAHPTLVPFQNFATSDGWIVVGCAKQIFWERLVEILDDPTFRDGRFADFSGRMQHREELLTGLKVRFQGNTTAHWIAVLSEGGVPCAPINDVEEALRDPQVEARQLIDTLEHPRHGTVRVVRSAMRPVDDSRPDRHAAPSLGADRDIVLRDLLGASNEQVARWEEEGAFGASDPRAAG